MSDTPALCHLDLTGPAHVVSDRWTKWKRSFDYYIQARGVTDADRKRSTLLHLAGPAVQDLYDTLTEDTSTPDDGFQTAVATLDARFKYTPNHRYERFVFRNMMIAPEESYDQFVSRLRLQGAHCKFTDLNDVLCDQLLLCIRTSSLRADLLKEKDLKLERAMELVRQHEETTVTVRGMSSASPAHSSAARLRADTDPDSTAAIRERPTPKPRRTVPGPQSSRSADSRTCGNCGQSGHLAGDQLCPARGKTCSKCKALGHFGAHCRRSRNHKSTSKTSSRFSTVPAHSQRAHRVACDSSSADDFGFSVQPRNVMNDSPVKIVIGGVHTQCLVDSGASCNLVGEDEVRALRARGLQIDVRASRKRVAAYGNSPLDIAGEFLADSTLGARTLPTLFVVIRGSGQILLGRPSSLAFGALVLPDVHTANATQEVKPTSSSFRTSLEQKYPDVFNGVGELLNYETKIYIDDTVPPVAQRPRRIPFALQTKVQSKIRELLEGDIIEEVQGPTGWASPVVVIPKSNGDVRLCVDMRQANKAVRRQRYPMPTVDETLEKVNGSACFSKLDLKMGFHQLVLGEDSRHITTFVVDAGVYRFKRLMFGISSAPELYQHVIQQVIACCPGTINIADDIIAYGATVAEHDRNIHRLLARLKECGLTVNPAKRSFRQDKITFFGFRLSASGVQPTPDKIAAVSSAPPPKDASEVRSFLGLVGFCARFIPNLSTAEEPLRRLTHARTTFVWGSEQQTAFDKVKSLLSSSSALAYYSTTAPTEVIADASPVGLGAVLIQTQDGVPRVVSFASRTLSDVERRYSQTEREALGLVWACERFHQYLFGRRFTLVTDHKPLQAIYSPSSKPSARIERWVLRLQAFDFTVRYIPGPSNIADAVSDAHSLPISLRRSVGTHGCYLRCASINSYCRHQTCFCH